MHAEPPKQSPLLVATPSAWARLAAGQLDLLLADHAVCEQQAAVTALALVSQYPEDEELVERMTALAAALIEARSAERFACLLEVLEDAEVAALLRELGPAEERHWQSFHALASRELEPAAFEERWQYRLRTEAELAAQTGIEPTVHG